MADSEDGPLLSYSQVKSQVNFLTDYKCEITYAKGHFEGDDRYPDRTNFAYVDKWASLWPEKEAYVFRPSETERHSVTFSQLKNATEALAIWLKREFGLKKGDRVGILSLNRIEYVLCEFALSRLGIVSVRIYVTTDSKMELTRNLSSTCCRLLLCQHASLESMDAILALKSHDVTRRLTSFELPKLEQVICMTGEDSPGTIPLPNWKGIRISENEKLELYNIQSTISMDDDCSIYATSGSSGAPKFVVLSYAAVLNWPPTLIRRARMSPDDRFFADRPLAHRGGTTMSALTIGATMIIANPWKTVANQSASEYLLTVMKEEHVTCGMSFPYLLYDIVKDGNAAEFKKIKSSFFIFCGQLVNQEIISIVSSHLKTPLIHAYGSTEIGEICSTSPSDPVEVFSRFVGQVSPGCEIKIVDPESREILPRGEIGAIAIRRPQKWYYSNDAVKMAKSHDAEGFYYPGDMGRMAENGYLEIMGRDDDMMSVGTVKIYPGPIELMLCKHPSVDKAIVFGVPDPRMYEVIGAVVLPVEGSRVTKEEIMKFLKGSSDQNDLMTGSAYLPKLLWIVTSFPLTSSGKVDKKALRRQCLQTLK